jgi:disulfide bond formation protein DsbB
MIKINSKNTLSLILIFSIFALLAAYFIQYVLGHQPCNLCLIERIPYILSIAIITSILVFKKYERIYILVLSLVFFTAALISFYHFGIEQGFFSESLVCNLKNNENLTKDQLLKQLEGSSVISCKDVTFRVLGLSLATINTIISIILSVIMFKLVKNYEQNK